MGVRLDAETKIKMGPKKENGARRFIIHGEDIFQSLRTIFPMEDLRPSFSSWPSLALDRNVGSSGIRLWSSLCTPVSPRSESI